MVDRDDDSDHGRGYQKLPATSPAKSPRDRSPGSLAARPGYEVGYGRPPVGSRFEKGKSGNPRGRPKGRKNKLPALHEQRMRTIILEEAYRMITVRDGERNVSVPIAQAVLRSMAVNAVKGQHRSQRLFSELLSAVEARDKALHDAFFEKALDYKLAWNKELDRRRKLGITDLPDPIPHPDHIHLNMSLGTVEIRGPMTAEDKALLDNWRVQKVVVQDAVAGLRAQLQKERDPDERQDIEKHIRIGEDLLQKLESVLRGE